MDNEVAELHEYSDPTVRAKRAGELLTERQSAVTELARIRREAVEELRTRGMSHADVAAALGMTRSRVAQLTTSGPPPERAFLGTGPLVVAIGGKRDADNPDRPAVAQEDFAAYEHLRALALTLQLDITHEFIRPPGIVRLNRENLIVICGPRLSPLVAQVLEADSAIEFTQDEGGVWHFVDRREVETYHSPMDRGEPADVGYLARLPRPDGRGTFLYIAGVHAMGSSGVVHYLEHELGEVYQETRNRRFSTLVSCEFDPQTRKVTSSRRLTPLYRHEGS